jgi:hypothetical protein
VGLDDAANVVVGASVGEKPVDATDDGAIVAAALQLQLEDLAKTAEGFALSARARARGGRSS